MDAAHLRRVNLHQFESVISVRRGIPTISVRDVPGPDRTLVLGSTFYETFHGYLTQGLLHALVYVPGERVVSYTSGTHLTLGAMAREGQAMFAHPERTDYAFASVMRDRGRPLRFYRFPDERATSASGLWHGATLDADCGLVEPTALQTARVTIAEAS